MSELIDADAPVVTRTEIEIAAPPEVVWEVLTGFARWPTWNAEVKSMSMEDPVAIGSTFRWKAGPSRITSTIQWLEPPQLIGWTGKTIGINAVDVFHLERRGDATHVREEESWSGLVARLFHTSLQRTLDRSLDGGLSSLKAESERRAHES